MGVGQLTFLKRGLEWDLFAQRRVVLRLLSFL